MRLEINGHIVEVDDSFANLPPDQQQAQVEEIAASLTPKQEYYSEEELKKMSGDDKLTVNPLYGVGAGAVVGRIVTPIIEPGLEAMDQRKKLIKDLRAEMVGGSDASPGQKYMAKTGFGSGTGETVQEVTEQYKKERAPVGSGKVSSRITTDRPLTVAGASERAEQLAAEQARMRAVRDAERGAAMRITGRTPTEAFISGVARSKVYPRTSRIVGGGAAGYNMADAWNRAQEGDVVGAGISTVGAAGAPFSMINRSPKAKIIGGLVNLAAPVVNFARDRMNEPQERAVGGLVHMAGGRKAAAEMVGRGVKGVLDSLPAVQQTVSNPLRMSYPGIYERPDIIAAKAAERTAEESPFLKQLFGVTRDDLYEMSRRKGNMPGVIPGAAKNPKGSAAAEAVMTPQNEQRILDTMSELQTRAPAMYRGMHGWYTMDPMYDRLVQLAGPEEAARLYRQLNTFGGIESPNMPVPNEFRRASAAHMMAEQGRFPDWVKYGGMRADEKTGIASYPQDLMSVPGRVGHQRASASQGKYLQTGEHGMDSPKAPPYIEASSVPALGFQTDIPVGDAHWSRGVGLADVRTGQSTAESVSTPEIQQLAPWWRQKIAEEMGTESVPAQAILWGGLGHATGVKTKVGAPKLELQAIEIANAADRLGISPEEARDLILLGKERAGKKSGGLAHLAAGGKTPAWQRKEGKNPEGGLNAAGRASYHAETGGTLKRPQPEGGARRDSFCARMKGMKEKLTSSETAKDPDSRINKSLRKWNC